jgi:hypothetical protein
VADDGFEVKLTFDGIPERLVVPFAAIRVFFDPSVRYGLQFEDLDAEPEGSDPPMPSMAQRFSRGADHANGARPTLRSTAPKKPRVPRKAKTPKPPVEAPAAAAGETRAPKVASVQKPSSAKPADDKPRQDNGGAQIVSLDAFRKK